MNIHASRLIKTKKYKYIFPEGDTGLSPRTVAKIRAAQPVVN